MATAFVPAPPAVITRALTRFSRDQLAGFIAVAIDLLDIADGDPDFEEGGDNEPLSANGDGADLAWPEWHSRGRHKLVAGGEMRVRGPAWSPPTDDDEDDDAAEDDDPDSGVDDRGEQVNEDASDTISPMLPRYDVDQSRGPTNVGAALAAWQRSLRP